MAEVRIPDVAPGEVVEVVAGGAVLAVGRDDRGLPFALDGVCGHAGGPLGRGWVDGATLVCPLHGWAWRTIDGVCTTFPPLAIPTHPCRSEGDDVIVELG